ncbi:hypothetical protein [Sphingobacterium mizutaii]|uniref:hypothetical protein n=2 Tax=Sphingobacterium mizutaii TaxID=1010 RepID=UPI000B81BAA5|nr:hypothetical protein [Sphingobacterium mizutaii]
MREPFFIVYALKVELQKNISPLSRVPNFTNINPSAGTPLAPGSIPVAEKWKECRCLCDGIGLGILSEVHPIKRGDLLKDIPDNKAFYPCAGARAKSHLKWAEAFWLLLRSKSNEESIFCFF